MDNNKFNIWKLTYTVLAIGCLGGSIYFASQGLNQAMWLIFFGFCLLIVVANTGALKEMTLSLTKFNIRMRDVEKVTQKAQATIQQLQELATTLVSSSLLAVQHAGRAGGVRYEEAETIKNEATEMLNRIGATKEQIESALSRWHPYIEFDYAHYILGGPLGIKNLPKHLRNRLDELKSGGIWHRAKPTEIRRFLTEADLLTKVRDELLLDYEYYISHREHRRPEIWFKIQYNFRELQ